MDNNQYQAFYEERPTRAADFRRIARKRLKGFWWTAILVTLVASLLGGIAASGFTFNYNTGSTVMEEDYDPDAEINEEAPEPEPILTSEEAERFEQALADLDFNAMSEVFSEKYPIVGFILSALVIVLVIAFVLALLFRLLVSSPIKVGYQRFFLEVIDGNESEIRVGTLFRFFRQSYGKTIGLNFVHGLIMELTGLPILIGTVASFFTLIAALPAMLSGSAVAISGGILAAVGIFFLGAVISLCIRIPISYMYSMAHMIMADYPGVGAIEALRLSRQMMKGNKWRLFCLDFSFIGWYLLGACACGLGGFIVTPYQYAARAAFYHEVSNRRTPDDVEFPSINPDDYTI